MRIIKETGIKKVEFLGLPFNLIESKDLEDNEIMILDNEYNEYGIGKIFELDFKNEKANLKEECFIEFTFSLEMRK